MVIKFITVRKNQILNSQLWVGQTLTALTAVTPLGLFLFQQTSQLVCLEICLNPSRCYLKFPLSIIMCQYQTLCEYIAHWRQC